MVFIDDIIVYLKNEDDHMNHLRVVLQLHKDIEFFTKYSKCEFWLTSVKFHGRIISGEGVEVYPRKTEVVKN